MAQGEQVMESMRFALASCVLVSCLLSGCVTRSNQGGQFSLGDCHGVMSSPDDGDSTKDFCGYFLDRYPFFFLYDSKESYKSLNFERAVTVQYSDCLIASGAQGSEELNGELVRVRGVLHQESYETQGLAHGRIDGVERVESRTHELSCESNRMRLKRRR